MYIYMHHMVLKIVLISNVWQYTPSKFKYQIKRNQIKYFDY